MQPRPISPRVQKAIASLDEKSTEAQSCRTMYDIALENTLRAFPWPFATDSRELELVHSFVGNEGVYGARFAYRYPEDCLRFLKCVDESYSAFGSYVPQGKYFDDDYDSSTYNRNRGYPFRFYKDEFGRLIATNLQNARGIFVTKVDEVRLFTTDFRMALSYKLAFLMAPTLARGEARVREDMKLNFEQQISETKATAVNEEEPGPEQESSFVAARN